MTTIVGKDAPLEQSIELFTDTLKKLKIEVLEDNWLNPLDGVYSVHLGIATLPCSSNEALFFKGLKLTN